MNPRVARKKSVEIYPAWLKPVAPVMNGNVRENRVWRVQSEIGRPRMVVLVGGKVFESRGAASRHFHVSGSTIDRWINMGYEPKD